MLSNKTNKIALQSTIKPKSFKCKSLKLCLFFFTFECIQTCLSYMNSKVLNGRRFLLFFAQYIFVQS